MASITVIVNGATGKMGTETVAAITHQKDLPNGMTLVGAICFRNRGPSLELPNGEQVPLSTDLDELLPRVKPDVMVDFTNADACMQAATIAAGHSVNLVLGASGLSDDNLKQLDALASDKGIGIIVAPNFALGAIVLKKLVEQAAPYFDYVDIIESHHEAKIDAPSGFALDVMYSLGKHEGISIHSIRMPGKSAHHEVVFGAAGQTLSLRHDTLDRGCYMLGVLRCIRQVVERPGLVIGLENVLGL